MDLNTRSVRLEAEKGKVNEKSKLKIKEEGEDDLKDNWVWKKKERRKKTTR